MDFLKQAGLSLLGGWIIGIASGALKLPASVPPILGLIGAAGVLLGAIALTFSPEDCFATDLFPPISGAI